MSDQTIEQRLDEILNKYGLYHDKMSDDISELFAQELLAEALDMIPEKHHIAPNLDSHAAMVTYLKNEGRNETIDEMIKAAEERFK